MDKDKNSLISINEENIRYKIYTIRGLQVMLDSDLAKLYDVETSALNRQVKRNIDRFPSDFMFQLTKEEFENLKCQIGIAKEDVHGGRRTLPLVFTEEGISSLSGVIHTKVSIKINISIMRAFVAMRHFINSNSLVFERLDRVELKQLKTDEKVEQILTYLEDPKVKKSALFFQGQMFDAFNLLVKIIQSAKESIILVDNYINTATLDILSKKTTKDIKLKLVASNFNLLTEQDIKTFKEQYCFSLELVKSKEFHDRFLILDEKRLYHIGASLKDAGKKCFELSLIDDEKQVKEMLKRI